MAIASQRKRKLTSAITTTTATTDTTICNNSNVQIEWRLYPPESPLPYTTVFIRPKSAKEHGKRGTVLRETENGKRLLVQVPAVLVGEKGTVGEFYHKVFDRKRLLPVLDMHNNNNNNNTCYTSAATATNATTDDDDDDDDTVVVQIVVTSETTPYRNLAWSQLDSDSIVLELGCSTGECSNIILRRTTNWVGLDTSTEMIDQCKARVGIQYADRAVQCNVLSSSSSTSSPLSSTTNNNNNTTTTAPTTRDSIISMLGAPSPTHVFIDIGGNRDLVSVLRAISWTLTQFQPLMVVVKSRELVAECQQVVMANDHDGRWNLPHQWLDMKLQQQQQQPSSSISSPRPRTSAPVGDCTNRNRDQCPIIIKHPKDAALAYSPVDHCTPICRYHNYDLKHGCKKQNDGCMFDHEHCHRCLQKGHIALECPQTQ
jgi:hypothetical protein